MLIIYYLIKIFIYLLILDLIFIAIVFRGDLCKLLKILWDKIIEWKDKLR